MLIIDYFPTIPLILFALFLFILIWPFYFILINPTFDTTNITGAAFAVLAGIASVTFGWHRTIPFSDDKLMNMLSESGQKTFLSSLFFISGCASKYCTLHWPQEYLNDFGLIKEFLTFGYVILFGMALCFLLLSIIGITMLIYIKSKQ